MRPSLPMAVLAATLVAGAANARPEYVGAAPNVSCAHCHVSPGGGGPRNAFGEDIEAAMPFTGPDTNTWPALFCVDSDGDGKTNGQELGDPCGTWRIGDPSPTFTDTLPGDDTSTTAEEGSCDDGPAPTCELDPAAGGGGCAATDGGLLSGAGVVLAGLALRRRRRR